MRFAVTCVLCALSTAVCVAQDPAIRVAGAAYERKSCAAFFYSRTPESFDVYGQFELTYGSPQWKPEFGTAFAKAEAGARLRIGNNFFTTFDTSCPVTLEGGAKLAAGLYYLALEAGEKGVLSLVFLDPVEVRRKKQNANHSAETTGGVKAVMAKKTPKTPAKRLEIALRPVPGKTASTVVMRFGGIELTTTLTPVIKR